ncbi:hypothetical protein R6Q59_010002 [Mikania micrantha]
MDNHNEAYNRIPSPTWDQHVIIQKKIPSRSLYVSHFLSTWNSRGFEFGAILFLATIYPGTLLPMSVYALLRAAAGIVLSPHIGRYIDTGERLAVVRLSIVGQRAAVVASCAGFLVLLTGFTKAHGFLNTVVFGLLICLACIEKLCAIMNTVAIERDWVVVIAGSDEAILQELNSQMRRVDLFCKLVAPLAIALVDGASTCVAILVTLGLNTCAVVIEYPFIAKVYQKTPDLALARSSPSSDITHTDGVETEDLAVTGIAKPRPSTTLASFKTYIYSAAFLPSLALSMLYLTVLSFSGQMTTFLLAVPSPKMNSTIIGLLRTIATVFEITATFIAPRLMDSIGPIRAGIWCLSWQLLCLTSAVGLLWSSEADDSATGVIGFVIAIIFSRMGLWSFDLVAQLLIQNSIDASQRGVFSSAEASLQNFFELCTFAMTIVFSRPDQFKYPALVSLIATYCAAALYAKFVRDRRGHLIHVPDCLKHIGGESYVIVSGEDNFM